jgi:hypothetical protein
VNTSDQSDNVNKTRCRDLALGKSVTSGGQQAQPDQAAGLSGIHFKRPCQTALSRFESLLTTTHGWDMLTNITRT